MWEQFRSCAPEPNTYRPSKSASSSRVDYKAWARLASAAKKIVLDVMDIAEAFIPRPYIKSLNWYGDPSIHYDLSSSTNLSI